MDPNFCVIIYPIFNLLKGRVLRRRELRRKSSYYCNVLDFGESFNQKYMLRNTASDGELDESDDLSLRTGF